MVLALGPHRDWTVPVLRSEAVTGAGVPELADVLDVHRAHLQQQGTLGERRRRNLMGEVLAIATQRMRRELEASLRDDASVQELLDRVADRELDPASAATEILARRSRPPGA
jgi:LAO/AO transport system kinase